MANIRERMQRVLEQTMYTSTGQTVFRLAGRDREEDLWARSHRKNPVAVSVLPPPVASLAPVVVKTPRRKLKRRSR